jgi:anti-sigma factor (TIGR02949 family)
MSLLTCSQFMTELSEYLEGEARGEVRKELEQHVSECPNCWVVVDTTKKTIAIYKGMEAEPIPDDLHNRLMGALSKRTGIKADA